MATINYDNYYKLSEAPLTEVLTSFENKVWEAFHIENSTPRLIAARYDCDVNTTIECINRIIGKLSRAEDNNIDDKEERELRRRLKILEAKRIAHEQGTNELLIMSEV